jgi:D-alanine transaminase
MEIAYLNGNYMPADEIKISPDDRGFLFSDGIYEVVRWYEGFFYDMEGHIDRLRRSLQEVRIIWSGSDSFPYIAQELLKLNKLEGTPALVYLQVTRGVARRSHAFPPPSVPPTVYAFARGFDPQSALVAGGIGTILLKDPRWSRCDIKSVALLPNILSFQEAREKECYESIFVKDGLITECTHSNAFFVVGGTLFTHPESNKILSGITRKNVLRLAREAGIRVNETPLPSEWINQISEAFVTNTSFEIAPVISIDNKTVGNGKPGPITVMLRQKFNAEIIALRENNPPEA